MKRRVTLILAIVGLALTTMAPAGAHSGDDPIRFATFNASLNRFNAGNLLTDLQTVAGGGSVPQVEAVLAIIAINDPDVLLINEFDFDPAAGALFAELSGYPHYFIAPSNTGVPSGFDLDNNGAIGGPNDAFGFGFFPGQFGMLVLSQYPIAGSRTFQGFLWKDMPGALLPDDPSIVGPADWYSAEELNAFRLSSKSHWDVRIDTPGKDIHFLVSHPTPPVFDGPEDRNGTRNHDEIRFWADYVTGRNVAHYIYDDRGRRGGLARGQSFVIAGDMNSDPFDGDSIPGSAQLLLGHPDINAAFSPSSAGAVEQAALQGGANLGHIGDPAFDTADFSDSAPGNLRVDYVLPSSDLDVVDGGVFWPLSSDPDFALVGTFPFPSSDHRLVWIDIVR